MGSGVSTLSIKDAVLNGEVEGLTKHLREILDDPEFPICDEALGYLPGWSLDELPPNTDEASYNLRKSLIESRVINHEDVVWLRPKQFGSGHLFSGNEPAPQHLNNNFAYVTSNNSYPISIASYLTTSAGSLATRPDYIKRLFVFYNDTVGCAGVRLWNGKQLDLVVIDDKVPCWRFTRKPIFSAVSNGDAWLPLLEKAIAKMFGSYENACAVGGCKDILRDISGEVVLEYVPGSIIRNGWKKDLLEELTGKFKSGMSAGLVSLPSAQLKPNTSSNNNLNINYDSNDNNSINNDNNSYNDLKSIGSNNMSRIRKVKAANTTSIFDVDHSQDMVDVGYRDCVILNLDSEDPRGVEILVDDGVVNALALAAAAAGRIAAVTTSVTRNNSALMKGSALEDGQGTVIGGATFDGLGTTSCAETIGSSVNYDRMGPLIETKDDNTVHSQDNNSNCGQGSSGLIRDDDFALAVADICHFQRILVDDFNDPTVKRKRRVFIPFDDLLHLSNSIKICLLQSTPEKSHSVVISGKWSNVDSSAAGGKHLSTWRENPIYRLKISRRFGLTGLLRISLSQNDSRFLGIGHEWRERYDGVGITVLSDEPRLAIVLAESGYKAQRDIMIEMMLTEEMGNTILIIPSTFDYGLETDFLISVVYVVDTEFDPNLNPMSLERTYGWELYPFYKEVSGCWALDSGRDGGNGTAQGRISGVNPQAFLNPGWKMTIDATQQEIDDNFMVEMMYILAQEQSLSIDPELGHLNVENQRVGLYTMTPFAYSQLLYNNGNFGLMDIDDGYLSKVPFADTPEIARINNFRIRGDVSSDSKDYRELIMMASTWNAGTLGRFRVKIYCNRPFKLEFIDPATFPEMKRLPIKSTVALKNRSIKISQSEKSLRDLKASVVASATVKDLDNINEAQRLVLDRTSKLPHQDMKNLSFLSVENNSVRRDLSHEVGVTSYYSHQLIKSGVDFEPLSHFERRKLEVKKKMRKYRTVGFTHYKPENYYWDIDDENNVSMIKSRSNNAVTNTKVWDPIGSYKESIAAKIREDTAKAFVHLETVVWKERYDPSPKVEEEFNPYLDIFGTDDR